MGEAQDQARPPGGALTCDEQRVHARGRLGGLEHFAEVLLGQRQLSAGLALGVLLLTPLQVLRTGERVSTVTPASHYTPSAALYNSNGPGD